MPSGEGPTGSTIELPLLPYIAAPLGVLGFSAVFVVVAPLLPDAKFGFWTALVLAIIGVAGTARRLRWRSRVRAAVNDGLDSLMVLTGIEWGASGPFGASRELWAFVQSPSDSSATMAIPLVLGQRRALPLSGSTVRVIGQRSIFVLVRDDGRVLCPLDRVAAHQAFPWQSVPGPLHGR